jgi:ATP-dependent DNA helicase PIF1
MMMAMGEEACDGFGDDFDLDELLRMEKRIAEERQYGFSQHESDTDTVSSPGITTSLVACESQGDETNDADVPITTTTATAMRPIVLNDDQQAFVDWLPTSRHRHAFVVGGAGVGKSMLIERTKEYLDANNLNFMITASTGAAAVNIGGTTIHRALGIGKGRQSLAALCGRVKRMGDEFRDRWMNLDVLIYDEVSMTHADVWQKIIEVIIFLRGDRGLPRILVFGDPFQMPPVMNKKEREERQARGQAVFWFQTDAWKMLNAKVFILERIERQSDPHFARVLSLVRIGDMTDEVVAFFRRRVEATASARRRPGRPYGPNDITDNKQYEAGLTRIRTHTKAVELINLATLDRLAGAVYTYKRVFNRYRVRLVKVNGRRKYEATEIRDPSPSEAQTFADMQETLAQEYTADEPLHIKVGMEVMFVCNLDPENGIVNNTRATIVGIVGEAHGASVSQVTPGTPLEHDPIVRLHGSDRVVQVSAHTWRIRNNDNTLEGRFVGYPLRLASAFTSHKSQGCTIRNKLEADITKSKIFEYGQAYVILSRVTSSDNLYLVGFDRDAVRADPVVKQFHFNGYKWPPSSPSSDTVRTPDRTSPSGIKGSTMPQPLSMIRRSTDSMVVERRRPATAEPTKKRRRDDLERDRVQAKRQDLLASLVLDEATGNRNPWDDGVMRLKKTTEKKHPRKRQRATSPAPVSKHNPPTQRFGLKLPIGGKVSRI